jgi:hypothetical protein
MSNERTYKRSWKNLLINKRYQLGWWVMQTASEATTVAIGQVLGPCPKVPDISEPAMGADPDVKSTTTTKVAPVDDVQDVGSGSGTGTGTGSSEEEEPHHRSVTVTLSSMTEVLPTDYAQVVAGHWTCVVDHAAKIGELEHGKRRILYVLVGVGLLLVIALAVYGIKTTHKVAGPLYKVTLYFQKMRDGRYDKVWPLRKGDQLVAFYEHFRHAHEGVVALEEADIERLRAAIAAADAAGIAGTSPDVDAALAELKAILDRKEKSLA